MRLNSTSVYELMDHLGNVRATFGRDLGTNDLLVYGYTDYYPFGSPLPGRNQISSPQYEHGYQGQFTEKDEEIGLDAFELRMWDSRLARWTSTDPYGQFYSPYLGMGNNPISGVDPDGGFWSAAATKVIGKTAMFAAGGAIVGAAFAGATGGDVGQGAIYGAIGGAAGYGASFVNWGAVGEALKVAGGALASGAKTTFSSPSIYVSMLSGGIDGYSQGNDIWKKFGSMDYSQITDGQRAAQIFNAMSYAYKHGQSSFPIDRIFSNIDINASAQGQGIVIDPVNLKFGNDILRVKIEIMLTRSWKTGNITNTNIPFDGGQKRTRMLGRIPQEIWSIHKNEGIMTYGVMEDSGSSDNYKKLMEWIKR